MNTLIPTPDTSTTGYHPVHTYKLSGGAKRAHVRRLGSARMRELRKRRRESGRPSPETLDRAVVDALRELLLRHPDSLIRPIDPRLLLGVAKARLLMHAHKEQAFEGEVPAARSKAILDAMQDRLLRKSE